MGNLAIQVDNLGKLYRMGERRGYTDLRQTLSEAFRASFRSSAVRSSAQPDRTKSTDWALRHVSCTIRHGEVVGILGNNGGGKTTLLKILSRITRPTEGRIEISGRIGALLDAGAGMHAELTGRENIYLNGAVLGMTRSEVDRGFGDIVAFAGLEPFLSTPLKHYSSGMVVRLSFSVAAHCDSDILLVDEVLTSGDRPFQTKCLGRLLAAVRAGRTVLVVSHDLEFLRRFCTRGVVFEGGRLIYTGTASAAVNYYCASSAGNDAGRASIPQPVQS